jgi:chromosome segregation ATPase
LNNAGSVLEMAKMENKSLSKDFEAVKKEKAKLQNKLQSYLNSRKLDAMKFNEYLAENQELKEEINTLRKSLEKINRDHSEKCKEVETLTEQLKNSKFSIDELNKKIKLLEQERGSYKRTAEELKRLQKNFLANYGNETNFSKQLDNAKSVMDYCKKSIDDLKKELTSVVSS